MAQVFSCEFCEISKNTFSDRTPLVSASEKLVVYLICMTLLWISRDDKTRRTLLMSRKLVFLYIDISFEEPKC